LNRFFISTPIGFEQTTCEEVQRIWPSLLGRNAQVHNEPMPSISLCPGGIEFEADLFIVLQLNFFLKTANRILLRLSEFRVRDFPKLYQKLSDLEWGSYFSHAGVNIEVAAQKSRLNNEKRILEIAKQSLTECLKISEQDSCGSIYIRLFDDHCTVSIDTTGEHLHKRGWSILKGEAPLRETIASFILLRMLRSGRAPSSDFLTLIDPMMGSGTLLTEAMSLDFGHFFRPFAFQQWVNVPKFFLSPSFSFNYKGRSNPYFNEFLGFDISEKMVQAAQKNFDELERLKQLQQKKIFQGTTSEFRIENSLVLPPWSGNANWLVVNPPYGERLEKDEKKGLMGIAKEYCQTFSPEKIAIIFPEKEKIHSPPKGYLIVDETKINNGGIRCLLTILERQK
jgi:putative N6-adenine-specific DNA methylase